MSSPPSWHPSSQTLFFFPRTPLKLGSRQDPAPPSHTWLVQHILAPPFVDVQPLPEGLSALCRTYRIPYLTDPCPYRPRSCEFPALEGQLACPESPAPSPLSLHQLPRLEPNDAESSQFPKPGVRTCARVPLGSGTQPWVPASQPPQAHSLLGHHPCSKRGNKNHGADLPECPWPPTHLILQCYGVSSWIPPSAS